MKWPRGWAGARGAFVVDFELWVRAAVEVADAEVGAFGELKRLSQGAQQAGFDIIEDAGHRLKRSRVRSALSGWLAACVGALGARKETGRTYWRPVTGS